MKLRRLLMFTSVCCLLAASAMPVTAGGWATIELDGPVIGAVVDQETTLSFMVLQHGESPVYYDRVQITANHPESGESITVMADPGKGPMTGHYTAVLTFTEPGRWTLDAEELEFRFRSSFPTLHVRDDGETGGAAPATTAPADSGTTFEIEIVGMGFSPALAEIEAGTTVHWTNQDPIKHEIAFADGLIDDSGIIGTSESFSFTFEAPGEYTFLCGPHPGMSGKIVVK